MKRAAHSCSTMWMWCVPEIIFLGHSSFVFPYIYVPPTSQWSMFTMCSDLTKGHVVPLLLQPLKGKCVEWLNQQQVSSSTDDCTTWRLETNWLIIFVRATAAGGEFKVHTVTLSWHYVTLILQSGWFQNARRRRLCFCTMQQAELIQTYIELGDDCHLCSRSNVIFEQVI